MNKLIPFFTLVFTFGTAHAASVLSAKEIMERNDEARRVSEFQAESTLETQSSSGGAPKKKDFSFWRKVQKDGVHNSTFTRFHAPAEVRDEGILIVENASGKNDVLLYLPNFKKVRRVESQQQSGSFMGSVFSYSDIASPHVTDYEYKILKQEKCPSDEAKQIQCSVIECTPSNDNVKERTGYAKSVIWVRMDNFMGVKGEYYNLESVLFKALEATQVKLIDAKNNKWLAHKLYIKNLLTSEYTRLEFRNVKANVGIPDSIFTQQNLQKAN